MKYSTRFLLIFLTLFITSCTIRNQFSRLEPQYTLIPKEKYSLPAEEGKSRIVFCNGSNFAKFGLDRTDKVDIVVDSKSVGSIWIDELIVVDLPVGAHHLNLTHYDIFKFSNDYTLEVKEPKMYIEVYNGIVSTKFRVVEKLPKQFENSGEIRVIWSEDGS